MSAELRYRGSGRLICLLEGVGVTIRGVEVPVWGESEKKINNKVCYLGAGIRPTVGW